MAHRLQRGLYRVHQLAMEGEEPVPGGGGGGAHGNLTRLLVCHSQAGCIIGKCAPCPAMSLAALPDRPVCFCNKSPV